ncbi:MAG: twin-arginine translocase TatA/TatE family subunit [Bacteroidetes bacterium MED-G17]|nr:MAG: twin-arginine translocase TatA/TatE family subunit [Bacteroidetes bacterium MED-G17]CAI8288380.1 MAG: Sec-independent protein translocase protein TatA [Bacteroidetes bacterium MED-G17]
MIFLIGLGINELLIVAMIVLLLFGGRKLPELMKGLGKGIREFNNAKSDIKNKLDESIKDEDEKKA